MAHLSLAELFPATFLHEASLGQSLGEDFLLCDNGNMAFHWADFHETCDAIKTRLENDPQLMADFQRKETALKRLSAVSIWIRTEKKVHQTTMYDLYDNYILNQTKLSIGVDPFGPIEISFISSTGPFRTLAIAECFNHLTYKDFIMVNLLNGKLPKRDYRVRMKARVLMEHGPEFNQVALVELEQMTMNGLLFSMDSDFFLKGLSKGSPVRFLLDTKCLEESINLALPEMKTHISKFAYNLLYSSKKEDGVSCSFENFNTQSSFDFLKSKKVYLFVPYDQLKSADKNKIKLISKFMNHSQSLIREHYKLTSLKKSA